MLANPKSLLKESIILYFGENFHTEKIGGYFSHTLESLGFSTISTCAGIGVHSYFSRVVEEIYVICRCHLSVQIMLIESVVIAFLGSENDPKCCL